MAEALALTTPYGTTTAEWRIKSIFLERGMDGLTAFPMMSRIEVVLVGQNNHTFTHRWSGQEADTLIVQLNKANLTTNTLQKRIFDKLVADGVFGGTVSGTPD